VEKEKYTQELVKKLKKEYSEQTGVDGKMILKLLLNKQDGKASIGFICIKMATSTRHLWAG
jgi:hypothetical protein